MSAEAMWVELWVKRWVKCSYGNVERIPSIAIQLLDVIRTCAISHCGIVLLYSVKCNSNSACFEL